MEKQRKRRLSHLAAAVLGGYLLIALALAYWSVGRTTALAARADNPRRVEAELRIRRGRILDQNSAILAETVGPEEDPERVYPIANIGPAVGYYSFRHGTSGVEEGYDAILRGNGDDVLEAFWRQNLHQVQSGRDIRLTLDATWQRAAEAVLDEERGALVLLTLPDGNVGALASHPSYDPNKLDDQFEALVADESAPLLNRASQGLYQPGLVLQPFILAAAVDRGLVDLDETVLGADRPVTVHGQQRECGSPPVIPATWAEVLRHNCPYPMLSLAEPLSEGELEAIFAGFGLTDAPRLPLTMAEVPADPVDDLAQALIGQDVLTLTPLQVARAWAALANGGLRPGLQLVSAFQGENGDWQAPEAPAEPVPAVSGGAAGALWEVLPRPEGFVEYATLALAGPGGNTSSWYLGAAPAGDPRFVVVAVLEDSSDVFEAQRIGRALLRVVVDG